MTIPVSPNSGINHLPATYEANETQNQQPTNNRNSVSQQQLAQQTSAADTVTRHAGPSAHTLRRHAGQIDSRKTADTQQAAPAATGNLSHSAGSIPISSSNAELNIATHQSSMDSNAIRDRTDNTVFLQIYETAWKSKKLIHPQTFISDLVKNPQALKHNMVAMRAAIPLAGPANFYIKNVFPAMKNGVEVKPTKPGPLFGKLWKASAEKFEITDAPNATLSGCEQKFSACSIPMSQHNADQWTSLDNEGPPIMLTAKLTGCTFAVRPNNEGIEVIHLQPCGDEDGFTLNSRMADQNKDVGGRVFGRNDYDIDKESVSVVGIRSEDKGWEIYAQVNARNGDQIERVVRVYPK